MWSSAQLLAENIEARNAAFVCGCCWLTFSPSAAISWSCQESKRHRALSVISWDWSLICKQKAWLFVTFEHQIWRHESTRSPSSFLTWKAVKIPICSFAALFFFSSPFDAKLMSLFKWLSSSINKVLFFDVFSPATRLCFLTIHACLHRTITYNTTLNCLKLIRNFVCIISGSVPLHLHDFH